MTNTNRPNDMSTQRRALNAARQARAEWLLEITHERLTPTEFINMARDPSWVDLRRESLRQVITAQPDTGTRRWREVRDRMLDILDLDVPDKHLTVGWVLDPRAGGRRYLALTDALRPRTEPWPGFPWKPKPNTTDDLSREPHPVRERHRTRDDSM